MFEASCSGNFLWYILEAAHSWNAGYKEQSRESSHLARSLLRGLCVARKMDHKDDHAAVWLVFAKPSNPAHISPKHFSLWLRPRSRLDCPETFLSSRPTTIVLDWFSTSPKWANSQTATDLDQIPRTAENPIFLSPLHLGALFFGGIAILALSSSSSSI